MMSQQVLALREAVSVPDTEHGADSRSNFKEIEEEVIGTLEAEVPDNSAGNATNLTSNVTSMTFVGDAAESPGVYLADHGSEGVWAYPTENGKLWEQMKAFRNMTRWWGNQARIVKIDRVDVSSASYREILHRWADLAHEPRAYEVNLDWHQQVERNVFIVVPLKLTGPILTVGIVPALLAVSAS